MAPGTIEANHVGLVADSRAMTAIKAESITFNVLSNDRQINNDGRQGWLGSRTGLGKFNPDDDWPTTGIGIRTDNRDVFGLADR